MKSTRSWTFRGSFRRMAAPLAALCASVLLAQGSAGAPLPMAGGAEQAEEGPERVFLDRYCTRCHNSRVRTAGLTLEDLDIADETTGAAQWEKVARKLRARAMPPRGAPRPSETDYRMFLSRLQLRLGRAGETNLGSQSDNRPSRGTDRPSEGVPKTE